MSLVLGRMICRTEFLSSPDISRPTSRKGREKTCPERSRRMGYPHYLFVIGPSVDEDRRS